MLAYYLFDPLLLNPPFLIATIVGIALSAWAQMRVKSAFGRYSEVRARSGMTGAEAAQAVCRAGGVTGVTIEETPGFLSDHYDPRGRVLRLSPQNFGGHSIAAVAVAAHEAGHAIQHATGYGALGLRSAMVPATQIGGGLWKLTFIIGIFLQAAQSALGPTLMLVGVALFALVVLFQLITLPVEIDASRRAKAVLAETGIVVDAQEAAGVDKVLDAAAMTYVASAAASVVQLLALVSILMRSQRR